MADSEAQESDEGDINIQHTESRDGETPQVGDGKMVDDNEAKTKQKRKADDSAADDTRETKRVRSMSNDSNEQSEEKESCTASAQSSEMNTRLNKESEHIDSDSTAQQRDKDATREQMDKDLTREQMVKDLTREQMVKDLTREQMDKDLTPEQMDSDSNHDEMDRDSNHEEMDRDSNHEEMDRDSTRELMDRDSTAAQMDRDSTRKFAVELKVPTVKPSLIPPTHTVNESVLNLSNKTATSEVTRATINDKATLSDKARDSAKPTDSADAPMDLSQGGNVTSEAPDVSQGGNVTSEAPDVNQSGNVNSEAPDVNQGGNVTSEAPCVSQGGNVPSEAPDVSQERKSHSEAPDVIMLSDEEDDLVKLVNGMKEYGPEEVAHMNKVIRKLQEDLRNEESKLVLLKKIRQSQTAVPPNPVNKVGQQPSREQVQPMRAGQQQPSAAHSKQAPQVHRNPMLQMHSGGRSQLNPAQAHMVQQKAQQLSQLSRNGAATRDAPAAPTNYRSPAQPPAKPARPAPPELSLAQRQAAAKLALRKQLEKTLLQIPPPKPPPPEMNFVPTATSGDFVPLVGFEEVVKFIIEGDAKTKGGKSQDVKYVFNPFTCVQCKTDFTPVWKRDKPGSKNVICEQCVTNNQKKALKQEHTNRLKSAFVKALQQEQEIEQKMLQAEKQHQRERTASPAASHAATHAVSHAATHAANHAATHAALQAASHASSHAASHKPSPAHHQSHAQPPKQPKPSPAHSHSASATSGGGSSRASSSSSRASHSSRDREGAALNLASQYNKATAEHMRQHQSLLQAHQAQLRALGLSGLHNMPPHMSFPFQQQQQQLSAKQLAELQRQYLLDMIQPGRAATNKQAWKK